MAPTSLSHPSPAAQLTRRSVLAGLGAATAARAQQRPPNFLVIVADDHGWNDVGAYGHPVVQTPNLDRLARDGVRFTHCYTAAPLCSPGRGAVMTGLYPHVSGVTKLVQRDNAIPYSMKPDLWTFAQGLKDLDYENAAARKWHLSVAGPTAHGFDHVFEPRDTYLDESVAFLEGKREKPFCLYFCPTHTHRPFRRHDDFPYQGDELAECLPPVLRDTTQVRNDYSLYLSETSKMDQEIGRLLDALERSGEIDRTVVMFLTDHGPSMHRAKFSLYDWGTHSSLIIRGPGVSGTGRVETGLASTIDVGPTILGLAGGSAPSSCQGLDLTPRLTGRSSEERRHVFSEHHEGNYLTAVRGERFKLIRNHTRDAPLMEKRIYFNWQKVGEDTLRQPYPLPRPPEELYDLAADPLESRNLAEDSAYAAQLGELRAELDRWESAPA